jgi:hypothetical protein
MKRSPADDAFSKCVRARTDYKCERCGKQFLPTSSGLHCSHVFSRRHRTIRWCAENAQALCYTCHEWYGGNPIESGKWVESVLGRGVIDLLIEKRNAKVKVSKQEEKEIASHYRIQLSILNDRREAGETGYLEFESYQ